MGRRHVLLFGVMGLILAACSTGREEACADEGLEAGSPDFQACVERRYAADYQRIQSRRYVPRNSR